MCTLEPQTFTGDQASNKVPVYGLSAGGPAAGYLTSVKYHTGTGTCVVVYTDPLTGQSVTKYLTGQAGADLYQAVYYIANTTVITTGT
jgi:hypothetical protein